MLSIGANTSLTPLVCYCTWISVQVEQPTQSNVTASTLCLPHHIHHSVLLCREGGPCLGSKDLEVAVLWLATRSVPAERADMSPRLVTQRSKH